MLLPWLAFNVVHFDNPIYPFAEGVFHGKYWNPELAQWWVESRSDYLNGTSLIQYFLLPITFTYSPNVSGPIYGFSPLYFIFIPLLFLFSWKREHRSLLLFILFFLFVSITAWFNAAPDWRYFFYIFPFLGVLVGVSVVHLFNSKKISSFVKKSIAFALLLVFLSNLFFFFVIFRQDVALWTGKITRDEYRLHDTQNYAVAQYINEHLPTDALLFLGYDDKGYYFDRPFLLGIRHFSTYVDYLAMQSSSDFHARLKELGVTHVVLTSHPNVGVVPQGNDVSEYVLELYEGLREEYLEFIYEENDVGLYLLMD